MYNNNNDNTNNNYEQQTFNNYGLDTNFNNNNNNINNNFDNNVVFQDNAPINTKSNNINNNQNVEEPVFEKEKKPFPFKAIMLILLLLALLVLALYYFVFKDDTNYEALVEDSAKEYFNINSLLPTTYGKCNTITLNDLYNAHLISGNNKEKLDKKECDTNSMIKVCMLSDGTYHYTTDLLCKKIENKTYSNWQTSNGIIPKGADIRFTFMARKAETPLDIENVKSEEYFEGEIPYKEGEYTTIKEQTYYRYRDKTYKWYIETNYYYPKNETNEARVNEYYITSPNKEYNKKGGSATVWRWYIGANQLYENGKFVSEAPGAYTVRGKQGPSITVATTDKPEQKSYRTITNNVYVYRTRKLESTDKLLSVDYYCKNTSTGRKWVNKGVAWVSNGNPCNDSLSTEVGTSVIDAYMCYWQNDKTGKKTKSESWRKDACSDKYYYVNENTNEGYETTWQKDDCGYNANAKPYICDRKMGYVYVDKVWQWSTPSYNVYYPDNKTLTYYRLSPTAKAIKDKASETTAYKWYKTKTTDLGYSKTKPREDAKKLNGSDSYTAWSNYTTTKIASSNTREVEAKKKLTIKKIPTENINWVNLSDTYLSEEELIYTLNNLGYKINALEDISTIENVNYDVQVEYREKK